VGVCPTEALELGGFDVLEFAFEFLKSDENAISCKKNFVCLAGLNVEYLISFGLVKDVVLDIGHCDECDIASSCFEKIEQNVAEANYVLENIGGKKVEARKLGLVKESEPNRREFFNLFTLKGAIEAKEGFKEEMEALQNPQIALSSAQAQAIRQKDIPNRRKLLFTILKKVEKPQEYRYLENEHLSFISDKEIEKSCDNCSICYRVCPTGALGSDRKFSKIEFDALLCIRCHLCHDVCEKESIKLSQYFDTQEFFEPKIKELITFDVKRCEDCGMWFSSFKGERLCLRCRAEEDAAKDLWGLK